MAVGTLRQPGADLARLPVGLDLRGIDVAQGVRAALACAIIIYANEWLQWTPLLYMALAANLTCFCDIGGPIRSRVPVLLLFTVLGALTWAGFGLLRPAGLLVVVPLACCAVFCNSFARVWGQAGVAVGNVLTVVVVFALDEPLGLHDAAVLAGVFVAGGVWAVVLALVIWRLYPNRSARLAVSEVWRMLAALAGDLDGMVQRQVADDSAWDAHARSHRRAVREAIEAARSEVLALARGRGQAGPRGMQALMQLETGDQLFGALIGLSDLLETLTPAERQRVSGELLGSLSAAIATLSRSIAANRARPMPALERAIALFSAPVAEDPSLQGLGSVIADRLRIMHKLSASGGFLPGRRVLDIPATPLRERVLGPVRANLTWRSATLRHAVRTAVISAPALVVTLSYETTFTHWLPYTVVLVMQPFFGATWQRALERVGGTVAGALIGGALAMLASTPAALALLMFPLCVIGFAARQVSYGAFIACLTPQIVVLVELVEPGHSSLEIAVMRTLFTLVGGLIAVVGTLVLWPSWEPERLREELGQVLKAHAAFARAVVAGLGARAAATAAAQPGGAAAQAPEATGSRAPATAAPLRPGVRARPGPGADGSTGRDAAGSRGPAVAEPSGPGAPALGDVPGPGRGVPGLEEARRGAGLASNNFEASISRALQEPRRNNRDQVEAAMVVDAALRRLAGRLSALQHDPHARAPQDAPLWRLWGDWLADTLDALSSGAALPPRPTRQGPEPLLRIARQVDLVAGAMRRSG